MVCILCFAGYAYQGIGYCVTGGGNSLFYIAMGCSKRKAAGIKIDRTCFNCPALSDFWLFSFVAEEAERVVFFPLSHGCRSF